MTRTMSPEMDAWLAKNTPATETCSKEPKATKPSSGPAWTREHGRFMLPPHWAWLWTRFARVSTPSVGFARRMQKTFPDDVANFSPTQKQWLLALSFKYRRQIFQKSAKWTEARFTGAVIRASNKADGIPTNPNQMPAP